MPCRTCEHWKVHPSHDREELKPLDTKKCKKKSEPKNPVYTNALYACEEYSVIKR